MLITRKCVTLHLIRLSEYYHLTQNLIEIVETKQNIDQQLYTTSLNEKSTIFYTVLLYVWFETKTPQMIIKREVSSIKDCG